MMFLSGGAPEETVRMAASDDTAFGLTNALKYQDGTTSGRKAKKCTITIETNSARYCLGGATPTDGASGLGHKVVDGDSIVLTSWKAIDTFKIINFTGGSNVVLQVTSEF
ncbi:MAG: hypothetical protein ACE5EE_11500 [Fidelibacterota bacterium]